MPLLFHHDDQVQSITMNRPTTEPAETLAYTDEERRGLAKSIMKLFELWQLDDAEALSMLGLPETELAVLFSYRNGEALQNSQDTLIRAGHLLAIHKSLKLLFRCNPELSYQWMKTRNRAFGGLMPVEAIRAEGLSGLFTVRGYLERSKEL